MKPLEKLVNSVVDLHKYEIVPAKDRVSVARQLLLFPDSQVRMYHHVSLGNYYESMMSALWGGKLTNRVHVARNGNGVPIESGDSEGADENESRDNLFQGDEVPWQMRDSEEEGLIKPDSIDREGKAIGESKACRTGHSCNLFDAQMHRYKEIQVLERESEIYFAFFRHNLMKVKSFQGTESDLFREMANRTFFAVRLPFSAVLAMHLHGKEGTRPLLFRRYDGMAFGWCTILKSPTLNHLFAATEETFEELKLGPEKYVFERYLSPKEFEIEGQRVKQFPILCVHDKNHGLWVKEFVSKNSELVERQEEYRRRKEEYDPRADGCSDV